MGKLKKYLTIDVVMAAVILLIVGILAFNGYVVKKLPALSLRFPGFVFLMVFVVGIFEIVRGVNDVRKGAKQKPLFVSRRNFLFMCLAVIGYIALFCLLGFVVSSIIFSVVFAVYHRYSKYFVLIAATCVIVIGLYFCFVRFLGADLPAGILFSILKF